MKRSNFLKIIATLIVAPTLMGEKTVEPYKEGQSEFNIEGDRIMIYTKDADKLRLRDLIISDMGDSAVVVSISFIGSPCIEARPTQRGKYRYKRLDKFERFGNAIAEQV